ncbi:MAG TPA: transposase [Terriglobales bacterium]|nr:transposase [Terriglobales bacterium]
MNEHFFLSPQFPMQRQYEALRAYLVDEEPSGDVARRFGYSAGTFRVLCYQFRHDPQKRASFFRQPQRGPHSSPARDRVRDLAVAMRKRNLSVYDMQRELAAAGHTISINSLTVLLREEGFSRLPRRADDERPATAKPEIADVADVRRLDLSPRTFRTPLAGLFLFVPLLDRIDLLAVLTAARLPSSQMIPAAQAVRSLLALKLIGVERKSHVMDLVTDQAIALFAGINTVPKRSYLAVYSSRIDHKVCLRFMEAWLDQVEQAGLPHGASFDLDFHSVPANSAQEPLEKHYVSSRSRSQKGILVFLARDAEQRVLRYANAGVSKSQQADEILQFVRFWKKHTGKVPAELVFDSKLTTYEKLSELNREGISFITLRRRSEKMLREIYRQPESAWQRISLPALTRIYRNPIVLEERVTLSGYEGELRQLTVRDLGHEEPTILLTNHRKLGPVELVTRYAQRMLIENEISEAVQFFHIDALSSRVGMKVDFDMQLTLAASSLYRMMAQRMGREYSHCQAKTVFRNLLDLSGKVEVTATSVVVTLDKRAHNPYLVASGLADQPTTMPWFGDKKLIIQFA